MFLMNFVIFWYFDDFGGGVKGRELEKCESWKEPYLAWN